MTLISYWAVKPQLSQSKDQGPVVQSIVSLTSSLRVISLTVLAESIYNILIFFQQKNFSIFAVSLDVNFNESLTNYVVNFEHLGPGCFFLKMLEK